MAEGGRKERASARGAILDATEGLMVQEGYAAVSTRRVAKIVGVTPALVHYHFATTDDLLLALFRRLSERFKQELAARLTTPDPLQALWKLNSDPDGSAIILEFMALSNHRKAIRQEIAEFIEQLRVIQAAAIAKGGCGPDGSLSPIGLSVLAAGMARSIVMEQSLGVSLGHAEALAMVDALMRYVTANGEKGREA
ncbi:TetR/AcrR family transcriptional regulator [Sphingobium sp. AP49]|uniref:TetR/AcrR family transcriptional regulator n=1 Tax=Sphingobium sp. AP49 TaxID=1144307 RepID=UPI00026ED102|nr:TetR/AcrR family transcriptional regulator [Sphingobium sp. AP49]WHO37308.1 TetR/AcrR family transcriptional regulator [Sphingobium sp. AP49]